MALNGQPMPKTPEQQPSIPVEPKATPEALPRLETQAERAVEAAPEREQAQEQAAPIPVPAPTSTAPAPGAPERPENLQRVESILEEGLDEYYRTMPPDLQAKFRQAGEQTAIKITLLLSQAKVQVKKIVDLIRAWLRIIPGVNKYFLEQEAKIKTDKILREK